MRYKISFKTKKDFYDILEYINRYEEVVLFTISIYRKTISLDKVSSELRNKVEEVNGKIIEEFPSEPEGNKFKQFLEREKELNLHQKRKVKVYDENGKLIGEQG